MATGNYVAVEVLVHYGGLSKEILAECIGKYIGAGSPDAKIFALLLGFTFSRFPDLDIQVFLKSYIKETTRDHSILQYLYIFLTKMLTLIQKC